MPSKKLKKKKELPGKFKDTFVYSEVGLRDWVTRFVPRLGFSAWVLLEGPLGAGKSTLARMILEAKGVNLSAQAGSPTFPILFEYQAKGGVKLIHVDLYRLKSEEEIHESGVEAAFFEDEAIVLCEWPSLFPQFLESLENLDVRMRAGRKAWKIELAFDPEGDPLRRQVTVKPLF